jgi:tetratricopeptide (TPR) repeat protein
LAQVHFALGDLDRAGALFLETVQALADENAVRRAGLPAFVTAWPRAWLGLVFAHLGRFADAERHAEDAVRIAEATDHPHTLVETCGALGGVSLERGDVPAAVRVLERGLTLLRTHRIGAPNILSGLGYAYALDGRIAEGLPLLEESLSSEASVSAMGLGLAVRVSRLAETLLLAGRAGDALARARSAVDLARTYRERANEALALRALGEVAGRGDPLDAKTAEEAYGASLALAESLGMRPLVAHVHLGLGRLLARTARRARAADRFTTAAAAYRELGMTAWSEQAQRAMTAPV